MKAVSPVQFKTPFRTVPTQPSCTSFPISLNSLVCHSKYPPSSQHSPLFASSSPTLNQIPHALNCHPQPTPTPTPNPHPTLTTPFSKNWQPQPQRSQLSHQELSNFQHHKTSLLTPGFTPILTRTPSPTQETPSSTPAVPALPCFPSFNTEFCHRISRRGMSLCTRRKRLRQALHPPNCVPQYELLTGCGH